MKQLRYVAVVMAIILAVFAICGCNGSDTSTAPRAAAGVSVSYIPDIDVDVDILPHHEDNMINCEAENRVLAVAILKTDDFDVSRIDHTTVLFEGAGEFHKDPDGVAVRHEEDVDGDGDIDLVFHFRLGETTLTCESTEGWLEGFTWENSTAIWGWDAVSMFVGESNKLPKKKK